MRAAINLVPDGNCWSNLSGISLNKLRNQWENYFRWILRIPPADMDEEATVLSRMFILAWAGLLQANNEMQIEIIPDCANR